MLFEQPVAIVARQVVFAIAREVKAMVLLSNRSGLHRLHLMSRTGMSAGSTMRRFDALDDADDWHLANSKPMTWVDRLMASVDAWLGNPAFGNASQRYRYQPVLASCPARLPSLSIKRLGGNSIGG